MKRILVGLVLLAIVASGVVAWAQAPSQDPLTARIIELQDIYRQVLLDLSGLADQREAIEAQITSLEEQRLRLEGGIIELQRLQAQPPVRVTGVVVPEPEEEPAVPDEPEQE